MRIPERHVEIRSTPEGLRMVALHRPGAAMGIAGIDVHVGSRDDEPGLQGMAHFVEHTIFKGTRRRSSWHIINRMEAVGGELNAFTTKEETVVYSIFPGGNPARAAELVADLAANSQFPAAQLDREREVVADEIDSYLDTPADAVFDDFEDLLYAGSPLGHNILGDRTALMRFDTELCRSYLSRWYVPANMVAFYAGPMRPDRALDIIGRSLVAALPQGPVPARRGGAGTCGHFDTERHIGSHQSHTVAGARVPSLSDPARYTVGLLTNILGGPGMNSLLNVELRERRGLVYNVEASTSLYTDTGALTIYYGCDPDDEARCRALVTDTVARVADGYITPRRLEMAKKQYLGQMVVGSENIENRITGMARALLLTGRVASPRDTVEAIRAITPADLAAAAAALLPLDRLTLR